MARWLLVAICFTVIVSCRNNAQNTLSPLSADSLATLLADTATPTIKFIDKKHIFPAVFEGAYDTTTIVKRGDLENRFKVIDLGKINLPTGKILACDPIVMHDEIAFTARFPKGEYPVQLALLDYKNGYYTVALSRILFSNSPVAKWEYALLPGQTAVALNDTGYYCYGVDGGMGIFIDSAANAKFTTKGQAAWEDAISRKFIDDASHTGHIASFDQYNMAVFSTGYGDGCYATFIGYDDKGNICRLLTDFGVIDWWKK